MKSLLLIILIFSSAAFAQTAPLHVKCTISEVVDGVATETAVSIESSTEKHGAMIFPKLAVISEVDMMIALHEGILIVNLYHNPSHISADSHGDITGGKNAHAQMILGNGRSVSVNCKF